MGSKVYVGNLSYNATEGDLVAAFTQIGEVRNTKIIYDRDTGRPRGFAFVEMTNDADAERAITELAGTLIQGRAIYVSEAHDSRGGARPNGGNRNFGNGPGHQDYDERPSNKPSGNDRRRQSGDDFGGPWRR